MDTSILIFTREQIAELSGVSSRRLTNWARQGVVIPSVAYDITTRPFVFFYDFADLTGICTIAMLIEQHHLLPRQLHKVHAWFRQHATSLPGELRLEFHDKEFLIQDSTTPEAQPTDGIDSTIQVVNLASLIAQLTLDVERVRQRQPEDIGQISRHRRIQHNAPVIAGTRIPTSTIWHYHEDGYSNNEILEQFPHITPHDIAAAIEFETRQRHAA